MPLTREDSERIWREVKANHAALAACPLHDFAPVDRPGHTLLKDYRCTQCGGRISAIDHSHYQRGVSDGLRIAADEGAGRGKAAIEQPAGKSGV